MRQISLIEEGQMRQPIPYRTEPYPMRGEEKTKLESSQEIENERLKAQLFFINWARSAQKKFG